MRTDGKPCWPPPDPDEVVPPYTLDDFTRDVYKACKKAWEDGRNEIAVIDIPNGMFPNVTEFRNPITRTVIEVRHSNMISNGMCVLAVPVYKRDGTSFW